MTLMIMSEKQLAKDFKIVITGALGHIGSLLIRTLPSQVDGTIVMIDNFSTQRYPSLFDLPENFEYKFASLDIFNDDLVSAFEGATHVVHLAAVTTAAESFELAKQVEDINLTGTRRVIEAAVKNKAKLVFISTTSIYASNRDEIDENCPIEEIDPQTPYARSKYQSETDIFEQSLNLDFAILRFGTIFGPSIGMRFHTAVNKFCLQAILGEPLTVWETALTQQRPYLDLIDAVNSIAFIIKNDLFSQEVFNVVSGNYTVTEVLAQIQRHVPSVQIVTVPSKAMNDLSFGVCTKKIQRVGFEFSGDISQGVSCTIDLLKSVIAESSKKQNSA